MDSYPCLADLADEVVPFGPSQTRAGMAYYSNDILNFPPSEEECEHIDAVPIGGYDPETGEFVVTAYDCEDCDLVLSVEV